MSKRTKNINRIPIRNIMRHRQCIDGIIDFNDICPMCSRIAWSMEDKFTSKSLDKISRALGIPKELLLCETPGLSAAHIQMARYDSIFAPQPMA